MPTRKTNFFISYNKADKVWARWIAWVLENDGKYTTVIQDWDFGAGSNFGLEMDKASRAERTLAVLSPDYLKSHFTQRVYEKHFGASETRNPRLDCAGWTYLNQSFGFSVDLAFRADKRWLPPNLGCFSYTLSA